jgi:hypothetical protein
VAAKPSWWCVVLETTEGATSLGLLSESVCQVAEDRNELEMSTPGEQQVSSQADALDYQLFAPRPAVKIVTFAGNWQNLDGQPYRG